MQVKEENLNRDTDKGEKGGKRERGRTGWYSLF